MSSERSEVGHRLLLATAARRRWVAVIAAIAVIVGPLLAFTLPSADRSFVAVNGPTQMVMSVVVAFVGVLLAADLRRGAAKPGPAVRVGFLLAAAVGVYGAVFAAIAVAVAGSTAPGGPWTNALGAALGGVMVQLVAQVFGLGFGAIFVRPLVAGVATFVPLAVATLLNPAPVAPLRDWVTPSGAAAGLLSGADPLAWLRAVVVLLIWGGGFWLAGAGRLLFTHADQSAKP